MLIQEHGADADIKRRTYGHFATFDTTEVRDPLCYSLKNRKIHLFPSDVQFSSPPALAAGLTQLDIVCDKNIRVDAFANNFRNNSRADLHINAWHDTNLKSATCTWLYAALDDEKIQTGEFCTADDHPWDRPQQKTSSRITFAHPYSKPPKVIVWLNLLDMEKGRNFRISARATEITNDGFTIHLDTWRDSTLHGARASWIAHPSDMPGITSGTLNTQDMRPSNYPQIYNSGRSSFPPGVFQGTPTVLAGLNYLDFDCSRNLYVKMTHDSVCTHGFNWNIEGTWDTIIYAAGASFIAFT